MDSGAICGQSSWDLPNNAISARAGPFMCRMRADEENTIMPESGEEGRDGELAWLCGDDRGKHVLSGKCAPDCARVAPMAGTQQARLSCEYRSQRDAQSQFSHKDGVAVAEIEPAPHYPREVATKPLRRHARRARGAEGTGSAVWSGPVPLLLRRGQSPGRRAPVPSSMLTD